MSNVIIVPNCDVEMNGVSGVCECRTRFALPIWRSKTKRRGRGLLYRYLSVAVLLALLAQQGRFKDVRRYILGSQSVWKPTPGYLPVMSGKVEGVDTLGHTSLAHLPLLPWEVESLVNRTCNPPPGIPTYCCIGSLSSGGLVTFEPNNCDKGVETYENSENLALEALLKNPVADGDNSQMRCDICRITDILIEQNWTLAFQGDSITRQTFVGLECELRRRGYSVMTEETFRAKEAKPRWRYGMDVTIELRVSKTATNEESSPPVAIVRFYGMYRPMEDMKEVSTIAESNDILIFDHGLHYGIDTPNSEFIDQMTGLVKAAADSKRLKLLAWRETSAQHFDAPGGHYDEDRPYGYCVPMGEDHVGGGNRLGPMMRQVLNRSGARDLKWTILPFREYTSKFHTLHTQDDCSHFCSTPSLWLHLWRTIRIALHDVVS